MKIWVSNQYKEPFCATLNLSYELVGKEFHWAVTCLRHLPGFYTVGVETHINFDAYITKPRAKLVQVICNFFVVRSCFELTVTPKTNQ